MSWTAHRKLIREEDMSYCLLGLLTFSYLCCTVGDVKRPSSGYSLQRIPGLERPVTEASVSRGKRTEMLIGIAVEAEDLLEPEERHGESEPKLDLDRLRDELPFLHVSEALQTT
jgi:hypothetical protein